MKIKQSFEQAICIVLIMSSSEGPVKSFELSERLGVSDSYLKKVIRQLVIHGLITSMANKNGGFILKKEPTNISFLDIFEAIEGKGHFIESTNLVEKVFDTKKEVQEKETMIMSFLNQAEDNYKEKLRQITIQNLIDSI